MDTGTLQVLFTGIVQRKVDGNVTVGLYVRKMIFLPGSNRKRCIFYLANMMLEFGLLVPGPVGLHLIV